MNDKQYIKTLREAVSIQRGMKRLGIETFAHKQMLYDLHAMIDAAYEDKPKDVEHCLSLIKDWLEALKNDK